MERDYLWNNLPDDATQCGLAALMFRLHVYRKKKPGKFVTKSIMDYNFGIWACCSATLKIIYFWINAKDFVTFSQRHRMFAFHFWFKYHFTLSLPLFASLQNYVSLNLMRVCAHIIIIWPLVNLVSDDAEPTEAIILFYIYALHTHTEARNETV